MERQKRERTKSLKKNSSIWKNIHMQEHLPQVSMGIGFGQNRHLYWGSVSVQQRFKNNEKLFLYSRFWFKPIQISGIGYVQTQYRHLGSDIRIGIGIVQKMKSSMLSYKSAGYSSIWTHCNIFLFKTVIKLSSSFPTWHLLRIT